MDRRTDISRIAWGMPLDWMDTKGRRPPLLFLALMAASLPLAAQGFKESAGTEARIDALLTQMTPEEKAGQMTQVTIDLLSKPPRPGAPHELDPAKLETAIWRYK